MKLIDLWIPGRPVPQGSKRPVRTKSGKLITLDSSGERLGKWRDRIAWDVRQQLCGWPVTDKPVQVHARFFFARPKAHLRKSGDLKPSAPTSHCQRPDVDKLERSLLDALTDVVWHDDSQVQWLLGEKHWGPENGLQLTIDVVG